MPNATGNVSCIYIFFPLPGVEWVAVAVCVCRNSQGTVSLLYFLSVFLSQCYWNRAGNQF